MEMGMVNSYEDWVELYKISFWELQLENITDQAMIEILESQKWRPTRSLGNL
jgi:serine protease inhibitor